MNKVLRSAFAVAVLALAVNAPLTAARANDAVAVPGDADYEASLARVKQDDLSLDFKILRQQHAAHFHYFQPAWAERQAMFDKVETDAAAALAGAEAQLQRDYMTPEAHFVAEVALNKLGRPDEAQRHHAFLSAWLQSITEKKDGLSTETAWNAASVPEEYFALYLLDLKPKGQALVNGKTATYDAMNVIDGESGKKSRIYFDISSFFGKQFGDLGK